MTEPQTPAHTAGTTRFWRAAGVMSIGTAVSRIAGLLRVAALTYALGVTGTRLADTYNLANTTPNIIYELFLGGILTAVFIPVLVEARARDKSPAPDGDSALVSVALIALAVVSVLAAVGAPLIMRIYTFRISDPSTRAAQLELATYLLRWFAPQIFFYGVWAIAQALLNLRGVFGPASFVPALNNLVVAGTLFAFARIIGGAQSLGLTSGAKVLLGAGTTAGVAVQAITLLPYLRKERIRFRPKFRDPAVTKMLRLAVFVAGYVVINQIGLWVVLALANGRTGGVTSWQVAYIFFQLPHGLFAVSIYTALFPDLSRAASARDWDAYRDGFARGVRGIAFLLVPAAIGYGLLADPIARLLLARGVADAGDAAAVASVLKGFAWSLVFFSTFQLLTRCFYALSDARTPTTLNAAAVAVNIVVNIPLYAWLGVRGLAFGHAIAYAVGVVLLMLVLNRKVPGGLDPRALIGPLCRISAAAAGMGICVWALTRGVRSPDVLVVGASVGAGAILYLAFSQVAGVGERSILLDPLGRRLRGGRG
jgi:putative peptidoglycan lipid II flippase